MVYKQIHLTLLSGLFLFTITNASDGEKALYDVIGTVASAQINGLINYGLGLETPFDKSQKDHVDAQTKLADQQLILCDKDDKLKDQQSILNDKQAILVDKQSLHLDKQIEESELDKLSKKLTTAHNLPDSPKRTELIKRIELQLDKLCEDLPKLPTEETKKSETTTEDKDKPNKAGLFSSLVTYYGLAAVAAGTAADNLAYYSFKNITDLECFKGSFIDTHSKVINQALVAVTLTALAYKTYSLYKTYKAEKSAQDEDIFNDDLE